MAQQFGFQREVDDLGDPQFAPQQLDRHWHAWQFRHAHRGGVDQAVRLGHGRGQIVSGTGPASTEVLVQIVGQGFGTAEFDVKDTQGLDTFRQQRMGNGRAGTSGAHLHHGSTRNIAEAAAKTLGKPEAVGVVADALAALEHHGVHRANAAGLCRELIEQRDDRLLAGEGDVQAGEAHAFGGGQQIGQGTAVEFQRVEVDQSIEIAHALGIAFMLVERGSARRLDACADQAGQYGAIRHAFQPFNR
ncbi:hypothetical protein SRABI112_05372 [Pseudomonas mediterranea]|nr:hypothetical protein SRABI112_05372 [Pseudomonas mediterranea]